jgi:uncharacterized protein YneF (UPF0154 family)
MFINLDTQKGYAALIGLLITIILIGLIVYGGSFFSEKSTSSQLEFYNEVKEGAVIDLTGIEGTVGSKQQAINE